MRHLSITLTLILLVVLAACQPEQPAAIGPTAIPFPTMTIGQRVTGLLTPAAGRPLVNSLSNPATVEALGSRPTETPDYSACPPVVANRPEPTLPTDDTLQQAVLDELNGGGNISEIEEALKDTVIGENGSFQSKDLTGVGTVDWLIAYTTSDEIGRLWIIGCANGRYDTRYSIDSQNDDPPQILWVGDLNRDFAGDVVFARSICEGEACEFETQAIGWDRLQGRFINRLDQAIIGLNLPTMRDIDNDAVTEIVLDLKSGGTSATGPLRTGLNVYDWDGSVYTLSIIQLEPPRYRIQVIHEADKAFSKLDMLGALTLFQLALDDPQLDSWYNDESATLLSYALYRMLLIHAYTGNIAGINDVIQRLVAAFPPDAPPEDQPPYVAMAYQFATVMQANSDLHRACLDVQDIIEERPESLDLMNRYGTRSPDYTPLMLCPY
jgi:hypothetical protein